MFRTFVLAAALACACAFQVWGGRRGEGSRVGRAKARVGSCLGAAVRTTLPGDGAAHVACANMPPPPDNPPPPLGPAQACRPHQLRGCGGRDVQVPPLPGEAG
eukprot:CAMPEP_0118886780 /NCGR_PEP_ID=MMETSP1163-20130328/24748_1 /TAXON_ID=124430 /ORGANISM="Phaeomonas parva, Strain CCMP2877" /LENGTH=102 /DNA_ID=CAMNT_0006825083 /DNA_START=33 /DNA_END=338 /DNA_ORIENTATION=-